MAFSPPHFPQALPNATRPMLDRASVEPQSPAARAIRDWQAHVDAGRIGVAVPPAAEAGALRCASLAAILGGSRRRGVS